MKIDLSKIIAYGLWLLIIFHLPFFVKSAQGAKAWLENAHARNAQGSIIVDATLQGAFSPDITEAVSSGAPTRFRFQIRLKKNRGLWLDKKIQEFDIHHTVTYDVLKKEYLVTRTYPDGTEENLTTSEWEEMAQWMIALDSVQLIPNAMEDPDAHYYLKLRAQMKCIKIPFPLNYLLAFVALWNFDTPWIRIPLDVSDIRGHEAKGSE